MIWLAWREVWARELLYPTSSSQSPREGSWSAPTPPTLASPRTADCILLTPSAMESRIWSTQESLLWLLLRFASFNSKREGVQRGLMSSTIKKWWNISLPPSLSEFDLSLNQNHHQGKTSEETANPFQCLAFVCDSRQTARRLTFSLAAAFKVRKSSFISAVFFKLKIFPRYFPNLWKLFQQLNHRSLLLTWEALKN